MRRLIVLVSTMVLPLLVGVMLLSAVALAEDIRGTLNPDDLQGTNQKDRIYGDAGSDRLRGLAGVDYLDGGIDNDILIPGGGRDTVLGSDGADHIRASLDGNGRSEPIDCGAGNDFVYKDSGYARTLAGCEHVKVASALPSWPIKDADGDTWADDGAFADNCPNVANASQEDADGDGRGDACSPALTVSSGVAANNKEYDGGTATTLSFNNPQLSGVLTGDAGNVSVNQNSNYSANFASASVGTGKAV